MTPDFLRGTFDKTVTDTTYSIDARPVHLALLGAAVALLLLLLLLVAARRRAGAVVSPLVPALGFFFVAFPVFFYATRRLAFTGHDDRWSVVAFHDALYLDAIAFAVATGAGAAALLVVSLRTANQIRLLPYALPCAMLAVALASTVNAHSESISSVGYMPFYGRIGARDMHVGRERDVKVSLMRPPGRRFLFWSEDGPQPIDSETSAEWHGVERVRVRGVSAGKVPFVASAHRGPVTLTTRLEANAIAETASPLLSLRVGDRFVYRVRAKSSEGAVLYFVSIAGTASTHEVVVEVIGTRDRGPYRTFVIEVRRGEIVRHVEVVALAGTTREYDAEHDTVGAPIIEEAVPLRDVGGIHAATADGSVECSFALFAARRAVCQRGGAQVDVPAPLSLPSQSRARKKTTNDVGRAPVAFAAAAPATFDIASSNTAGTIATLFIAIATAGLVILPDGSSSSSYTLVSTQRGPVGAAEAPPG